MPGETVLDPFGGIMTVPYRALRMGRNAVGIELKPDYFRDGVVSMKLPAEGGEAGAVRLGGNGRKANRCRPALRTATLAIAAARCRRIAGGASRPR